MFSVNKNGQYCERISAHKRIYISDVVSPWFVEAAEAKTRLVSRLVCSYLSGSYIYIHGEVLLRIFVNFFIQSNDMMCADFNTCSDMTCIQLNILD